MSAMPGMCLPIEDGGVGFDYRLAMGEPDLFIKLLKKCPDEQWDMWRIWGELSGRRPAEKYIGYAESHDQALVGDKTLMFRLCDSKMYTDMNKDSRDPIIERGMSLHKMIRLAAATLGGEGYLNFMGNEFGHPEWIDFPREGNGWSYFYCRRQWHLADDTNLKYGYLREFDKAMISLAKDKKIFRKAPKCLYIDDGCKILTYERAGAVFALNFNPSSSYEGYWLTVPSKGRYKVVMSTDREEFGGHGRISEEYVYTSSKHPDGKYKLQIYLPARTGLVLEKLKNK